MIDHCADDLIPGFLSVNMDDVEAQQMFDDFFEEVFCDLEDKVNASSQQDSFFKTLECIC